MRRAVALVVVILVALVALPTHVSGQIPSQTFPETGYTVADTPQGRFWSEFRRLGGLDSLGYPISEPFVTGGFTYQAFQRAALQWRPELDQALLANTMDWMSDADKDPWLAQTYGVPGPLKDGGGSWEQVVAERESWLTEPTIAQAYRDGGGYNRFGLPASRPETRGSFIVQRFQRYVFQLWITDVPGMPAKGSVVGVLVGDMLKQAGIISSRNTSPTPTATPAPPASCKVEVFFYGWEISEDDIGRSDGHVVNTCSYPVHVTIDVVSYEEKGKRPKGDAPTTFVKNLNPGEERTIKGFYVQAPQPAAWVESRLRWFPANVDDGMLCSNVQASKCLRHDMWLAGAIRSINDWGGDGQWLLKVAAENDVRIVKGITNNTMLTLYDRVTKTVTIDPRTDNLSSWARGALLAHALQHAADDAAGTFAQDCVSSERTAFTRTAYMWHGLWWGQIPPLFFDFHDLVNQATYTVLNAPTNFMPSAMDRLGSHCQ